MRKGYRIFLLLVILILIVANGIVYAVPQVESDIDDNADNQTPTYSATIMAVGDIMMHMPQIQSGYDGENYDYTHFFQYVKPIFGKADFVIGNLETTLAGPARRYSGYPAFNAPDQLADAIKDAGFNVITTANNHSLDKGTRGLIRTLDQLDSRGLAHTGTFRSAEERNTICLMEKRGIVLGVVNYTYGTNVQLPSGKDYLINYIDLGQMKADIKLANQLGADIVVAALHFGREYKINPDPGQIKLANYLFSAGADLIIGSHPHVLQPHKTYHWTNNDGEKKKGVIAYSLGNFISNQRKFPRNHGGILSVKVEKRAGKTTISNVDFIETYIHRYNVDDRYKYHVVPLKDYINNFSFWGMEDKEYQILKRQYQRINKHISSLQGELQPKPGNSRYHIMRPGETLYRIARIYNTSTGKIIDLNPGIKPRDLRTGQIIYIPPESIK